MHKNEPIYHVFLSYAAKDVDLANQAAHQLAAQGLTSFHSSGIASGEHIWERVREVIAECAAVVCLFRSDAGPSSSVALELGAAAGWSKPVFLVTDDTHDQPRKLWGFDVFGWNDWPEIVRRIKTSERALSKADQMLLEAIYQKQDVALDRLMSSPSMLDNLTREFNKKASRSVSGERLVQALLRRLKIGHLPARTKRPRSSFKTPAASGTK